jgi:hypothetical protein
LRYFGFATATDMIDLENPLVGYRASVFIPASIKTAVTVTAQGLYDFKFRRQIHLPFGSIDVLAMQALPDTIVIAPVLPTAIHAPVLSKPFVGIARHYHRATMGTICTQSIN